MLRCGELDRTGPALLVCALRTCKYGVEVESYERFQMAATRFGADGAETAFLVKVRDVGISFLDSQRKLISMPRVLLRLQWISLPSQPHVVDVYYMH